MFSLYLCLLHYVKPVTPLVQVQLQVVVLSTPLNRVSLSPLLNIDIILDTTYCDIHDKSKVSNVNYMQ